MKEMDRESTFITLSVPEKAPDTQAVQAVAVGPHVAKCPRCGTEGRPLFLSPSKNDDATVATATHRCKGCGKDFQRDFNLGGNPNQRGDAYLVAKQYPWKYGFKLPGGMKVADSASGVKLAYGPAGGEMPKPMAGMSVDPAASLKPVSVKPVGGMGAGVKAPMKPKLDEGSGGYTPMTTPVAMAENQYGTCGKCKTPMQKTWKAGPFVGVKCPGCGQRGQMNADKDPHTGAPRALNSAPRVGDPVGAGRMQTEGEDHGPKGPVRSMKGR